MKLSLRFFTIAILFFAVSVSASARTRKVLFIGNSFIYTNNMPLMLQNLAATMGDTLIYDQNTPGGQTLQGHSTDPTTITKIFSQQWDIVVLQEQSQRPAFSPTQVASDTYPYAHILDSMVRRNDTCTQTMFLMTWGYKNGDASNCAAYPVICTYEGMQSRLRESYMQMGVDNHAVVAPVGAAWKQVRDSLPALDLYSPDNMHPGVAGSYLEACVMYASIFHRSPVGSTYNGGLSNTDAARLQYFANKITLDSLSGWIVNGHYPYADFGKTITGNSVAFQNQSQKANSYSWDFGDGNTSSTTTPSHTYTASGTYTVKLTARNNCFSETVARTITISGTGVPAIQGKNAVVQVGIGPDGYFTLSWEDAIWSDVTIYDLNGRVVRKYTLQDQKSVSGHLLPGMYLYRFTTQSGERLNGKMLLQ